MHRGSQKVGNMKVFIISINEIIEKTKVVKVGESVVSKEYPYTACLSIALIAISYDMASVFILLKVV